MIYAETLRHFIQEWFRVVPPRNFPDWPWRKNSELYLINLYAISSNDVLSKQPFPFISILINNLEGVKGAPFVTENDILYKGYFAGDYMLPRRFLLNLERNVEKRFKTNRYAFTSDGYGNMASDWNGKDLQLLRILASRPHLRCSIYNNPEYGILRKRLDHMSDRYGFHVQTAENLLDCTDRITGAYASIVPPGKVAPKVILPGKSPELMLIQAPITGILSPIRKDPKFRLINGTFLCCKEAVMAAIPEEPCFNEYQKELIPFKGVYAGKGHRSLASQNNTKRIVYVAIESPGGIFSFSEYMPDKIINSGDLDYARLVQHTFSVAPELVRDTVEVRLHHTITEGLIPSIPENHWYLTRRNEKLFYRGDTPDGFIKQSGGNVIDTASII